MYFKLYKKSAVFLKYIRTKEVHFIKSTVNSSALCHSIYTVEYIHAYYVAMTSSSDLLAHMTILEKNFYPYLFIIDVQSIGTQYQQA